MATPTKPQQTSKKNLGPLLLLAAIIVAWIVTPMVLDMQTSAALRVTQQQQQLTALRTSLAQAEADMQEFSSKSAAERLKVIAAIPEKGKLSQANVLREVETILTGTDITLRSISFDGGSFSEGSGPKAVSLTLELTAKDAGSIGNLLKKFEGANRLYKQEGLMLTSAESGVNIQLRLLVFSRE